MQRELLALIFARRADVERAAGREQSAGKAGEPVDAAVVRPAWRCDAAVGEEREAVLIVERVVDVEPAATVRGSCGRFHQFLAGRPPVQMKAA